MTKNSTIPSGEHGTVYSSHPALGPVSDRIPAMLNAAGVLWIKVDNHWERSDDFPGHRERLGSFPTA